ncbi:hypothetical protein D3C75_1114480 [compost metagenome]
MVTLPRATGVTTPFSTVAIVALLVVHSAVDVTLVVLPSRSLAVRAMDLISPRSNTRSMGLAVSVWAVSTCTSNSQLLPPKEALTVAEPEAIATRWPFSSIVATLVLLLVHTASPVTSLLVLSV